MAVKPPTKAQKPAVKETPPLTGAQELIDAALYRRFRVTRAQLEKLAHFEGRVDCHCSVCGQRTTHATPATLQTTGVLPREYFVVDVHCVRCSKGRVRLFLLYGAQILVKAGQYPSVGDLISPEYEKYRNVLDTVRLRELKRGIQLASHDVGIGSFTYLRRVFESLVRDAEQQALSADPTLAGQLPLKMDERILALRAYLPEMLVKNRSLYGVLSLGIHELSEDMCLEYFGVVRLGIVVILDERLRVRQEVERQKQLERELQTLRQNLKPQTSEEVVDAGSSMA